MISGPFAPQTSSPDTGMSLSFETAVAAISKVQVAFNCTDLEAITKMQGAAAKAGDESSLEALCEIKAVLIGL